MAYSDFTFEAACVTFSLDVNQDQDLFGTVPETRVSPLLRAILEECVPLATSIHTEKARSELIVAPVLVEVRKLMNRRISLFSGVDFHVAPDQGLNGTCDFILAASPVQLFLRNPVLMIVEANNDNVNSGLGQCVAEVEANNDNVNSGLGQCVAEMVAARMFSQRAHEGPARIFGAVTTGSLWRFLKLDGDVIVIDSIEYYLDQLDKVLGILLHCVGGDPATAGAAA